MFVSSSWSVSVTLISSILTLPLACVSSACFCVSVILFSTGFFSIVPSSPSVLMIFSIKSTGKFSVIFSIELLLSTSAGGPSDLITFSSKSVETVSGLLEASVHSDGLSEDSEASFVDFTAFKFDLSIFPCKGVSFSVSLSFVTDTFTSVSLSWTSLGIFSSVFPVSALLAASSVADMSSELHTLLLSMFESTLLTLVSAVFTLSEKAMKFV
uniref:Uncharacterized protein n=1 Tax=Cacopsylla melanoneura TaxID=428564 RepID=A0A8D8LGH0_9HEMI